MGSWPCPPQGWHLPIRLSPNHPPLNTPCLRMASFMYWLQVGLNRQLAGKIGEITYW